MLRRFIIVEQWRSLSSSSVNVRQSLCLVPNFGIQGNRGRYPWQACEQISVRVALAGTVTLSLHLN